MKPSYRPGSVVPFQIDTTETSSYEWDTTKALLTQALYPNGSSQGWAYAANGDLTSVTRNGITTSVERSIERDGSQSATLANRSGTSKSTRNGNGTRTNQLISILVKNPSRGSYNYTPIEGDAPAGGESITAAGEATLPYESSGATDINEDGSTTCMNSCSSLAGSCIETCKCSPDGSGCDQRCMQECSTVDDGEDDDSAPPPEVAQLDIQLVGDGFGKVYGLDGHELCAKTGEKEEKCSYFDIPLFSTVPIIAQGINESTFAGWEKPTECRWWDVATHEPMNPCPVPMTLNPQLARAKFDACRKGGQSVSGNQQCCSGVERCGKVCGCPSGKTCDQSNQDSSKWSCSCTPKCAPLACGGSDGCGGTCQCPDGFSCSGGQCVYRDWCTPKCAGKTCGDDGCGGSCGPCDAGRTCTNGQCQSPPPPAEATPTAVLRPTNTPVVRPTDTPVPPPPCVGNCDGKSCGSDGCKGSCGTCPAGQSCSSAGQCTGASCRTEGMPCSNATATTPCCSGLTCTGGFCRGSVGPGVGG
jgi:hypothetical protein